MLRIALLIPCLMLPITLAAAAAPAPNAEVRTGLVNGSFEPPAATTAAPGEGNVAIPGWQASARGVAWLPAAAGDFVAPNGEFVVRLAADAGAAGCVAQTFATTPGESYDVVFWLGSRSPQANDPHAARATVRVDVAGTSRTVAIENRSSDLLWQAHVVTFTATGPSTTLSFRGPSKATAAAAFLDAVAIHPVATALGRSHAGDPERAER